MEIYNFWGDLMTDVSAIKEPPGDDRIIESRFKMSCKCEKNAPGWFLSVADLKLEYIALVVCSHFQIMKINNFWGDFIGVSAIKQPLGMTTPLNGASNRVTHARKNAPGWFLSRAGLKLEYIVLAVCSDL